MSDLSFTILAETADDAVAIERLHERTFGPGRYAKTAYRIREGVTHRLDLSFTARVGTLLVGSVRLSPVRIGDTPALLLGPLTIEPPFRDRGIGHALIARALKEAKEKGVLVIALDTETDPKDAVDATFATNNVTAGELEGKYVKATLGPTAPKLLMMDGTPGGTVDEQRHRGFLQGMGLKDGDPAIIGAAPTNGDQNKAQAAMENLLQRDSSVNAVYTLNEPAARGAVAALTAKGLAGKVAVGSIDGGCQGVADVKAGKYLATVMQFPKKMAEQGVDAVVDFAQNGKKPSGFVDTGAQLITDKPVAGLDAKDTAWGAQNCWG